MKNVYFSYIISTAGQFSGLSPYAKRDKKCSTALAALLNARKNTKECGIYDLGN